MHKSMTMPRHGQEYVHDLYHWILKLSLICYGKSAERLVQPCACKWVSALTPIADHTDRGRRENEDAFPEQSKLPQHHDLLSKEADELGHAASRVCDLIGGGQRTEKGHDLCF